MTVASVTSFVDCLHQYGLLKRSQLDEIAVDWQRRFPEPRALAAELLRRGWLTAYQVNQVLRGKAAELLLGSYILTERLGEGGMGEVYKARHQKLERIAALKLIRKDKADNEEAVRRFRREIEAVSQMSHSNIVAAYDAGQAGDILFFAMEFVEGTDLSRHVKERGPLPIPTACSYIRQAASGLAHAHERGMVHRDIKPANLLLTKDGGIVKIADLGLARWKRSASDESSTKALTRDGAVLGTLDYVAPEQAMDSHAVDIRADLYSLGCSFYFLLTGRVPYPGGEAIEKLYRHRYEEPTPLEQVRFEIPPPVATVVRKLMAKQPEHRYQTPAELAADLTTVLEGGTIPLATLVRPAGDRTALDGIQPTGQAGQVPADVVDTRTAAADTAPEPRKKQRRWVGGLAFAAMLLGGLVLLAKAVLPETAPHAILNVNGTSAPARPNATVPSTSRLTAKTTAGYVSRPAREESILATLAAHRLPCLDGKWYVLGPFDNTDKQAFFAKFGPEQGVVLSRTYPGKGGKTLSWQEWPAFRPGEMNAMEGSHDNSCFYLYHAIHSEQPVTLPVALGSSDALSVWLNGRSLLAKNVNRPALPDQDQVTLDLQPGANQLLLKICTSSASRTLEVCVLPLFPAQLQALYGERLQREFERLTVKETRRFNLGNASIGGNLVLSKNGQSALSTGADKNFFLWDVAAGQSIRKFEHTGEPIQAIAFSPDAKRALTAHGSPKGSDCTLRLWDLATGSEVRRFEGHADLVTSAAFSADGSRALSGSWDGTLRLWDVETGKPLQLSRLMPTSFITSVVLSADGTQALAGCHDRTIRIWDLQGNREIGRLLGHTDKVLTLDLSRDGKQAVSGSWDRTVRLWDIEKATEARRFDGHQNLITKVALSADGERIASCGYDQTVRLWDARTGQELRRFLGHLAQVRSVAFLSTRSFLVSADDRSIRMWALAK